MEDINKKFIIISILLVLIIGVIFICNKDTEKVQLDEVRLKDVKEENSMFAIMVQEETNSENYILYEEETWPTEGYTFNSEKSGCLDSEGKKISDVQLNYAEGKVKVETDATSYCYIYFDKEEPMNLKKACEGQSNMQNCITNKSSELNKIQNLNNGNKGDLAYRYVGKQNETINNYVCFGASSCSSGEKDNHLYRIIGITNGGNLKIQKNSSIGTAQWWTDYSTDKSWKDSKIYELLKGTSFYGSTTYVTEEMKSKIENHTWNTGDVNGTDTSKIGTGDIVYNLEQQTKTHTGVVGLAYLSDYYFAYNEQGTQNCYSSSPWCKSWMIPSNYQTLWSNKSYEWTMTRYGLRDSNYNAWRVRYDGYVYWDTLNNTRVVRPVFYLKSEVKISGGEGTLDSMYIIN